MLVILALVLIVRGGGSALREPCMNPGRAGRGGWLGAYVGAYVAFLYLPVALIPLFSFNNSIQAAFPLQGFTLAWYVTLVGNSALSAARSPA